MTTPTTIGVVIGRFQVPALHAGHQHTIDTAATNHDRLVILIGYNDVRCMPRNEMPVGMRVAMVQEAYPEALVLPLPDSKIGNEDWSQQVDQVLDGIRADGEVMLYGSRDSFARHYHGRFPVTDVPSVPGLSGTSLRAGLTAKHITTEAERRGWIAAIRSQYPVTDSVVDVAVVSPDWKRVLLGSRGQSAGLRFFGGFLDATDASDAVAAKREQTEEVIGIKVSDPQFIDSIRINDPRYRNNGKGWGVMTRFHVSVYESGEPTGNDDIALVTWVDLTPQTKRQLVASHHELFDLLLARQATELQQ